MKVTIHDAVPGDAADIVHLIRELAASAGGYSPLSEPYVHTYLSSLKSHVLLAELEGRVVGLLSYSTRPDLYHAADACYVEELVVHEGARGHGVGSALLEGFLSRLDGATCAEVSVAAAPDNSPALHLYRSRGLDGESVLLEMHLEAGLPPAERGTE